MLNENLDWDAIRQDYLNKGYTRILEVLKPGYAENIVKTLIKDIEWEFCCLSDNGPISFTQQELKNYKPQQSNDLISNIFVRAQHNFSYYYYRSSLVDTSNTELANFYKYLSSDAFLDFIRFVTDEPSVHSVNGQACCYRQSCFLKCHNDSTDLEHRIAAYVFGFTQEWCEEWGGLLHIEEPRGNIIDTLIPTFNSLTLFKVPTWHYVSQVANYSPAYRYTTTGWVLSEKEAES